MKKTNLYRRTYRPGNSTKRLLLAGSLVFACAIGVSATSTYAWYAISASYNITGLSMTIDGSNEYLKIGRKEGEEITFKEDGPYTLEDFGQEDIKLGNISNMFHDEYEVGADFTPYFYSAYRPGGSTGKTERAARTDYVQMEFYVETSKNALIYLNEESSASPNYEANVKTAELEGKSLEDLQNVTNASRVSFYSYSKGGHAFYNIASLGEHEEVEYAGNLDLLGRQRYDYNADDEEIVYGQINDSDIRYGEPLKEDIQKDPNLRYNCFNANHEKGRKMVDVERSTLNYAQEGAHALADYIYVDEPGVHPIPLAATKGGEATRLVVSIFLEGWDHDMTEALALASFDFSLGFIAVFDEAANRYL